MATGHSVRRLGAECPMTPRGPQTPARCFGAVLAASPGLAWPTRLDWLKSTRGPRARSASARDLPAPPFLGSLGVFLPGDALDLKIRTDNPNHNAETNPYPPDRKDAANQGMAWRSAVAMARAPALW